jgi:hypothetical protein
MSFATEDDVGDDAEPGELRAAHKAMRDRTKGRGRAGNPMPRCPMDRSLPGGCIRDIRRQLGGRPERGTGQG